MLSEMVPQSTPIYQLMENYDIETLASQKETLDSNLQKAGSLKDFAQELEKYAKRNRMELPQLPQKKMQKLEFTYLPSSAFVRQGLIFSTLRKCIENEEFWSSKGLHILLEEKYIMPGYDDEAVFECIIKYKSFTLFKFVSQTFDIVADKYIVRSLKTILHGAVVQDRVQKLQKDGYFAECPVSQEVIADISYVMLLPVDTASLKDYLKLLTVEEALILLQCFVFMLHVASPALEKNPRKSSLFNKEITETKIVMWMDLLLSAHLMAFSTLNALETLIADIRLCIQKQQNHYGEMAQLTSFLQYFKKNNNNKTIIKQPVAKYAIETISL